MTDISDFEDVFDGAPGDMNHFHFGVDDYEMLGHSTVDVVFWRGDMRFKESFDRVRIHKIAGQTWVIGLYAIEAEGDDVDDDESARFFLPADLFPIERVQRLKPAVPEPWDLPDDMDLSFPGVGLDRAREDFQDDG